MVTGEKGHKNGERCKICATRIAQMLGRESPVFKAASATRRGLEIDDWYY